jgi:hypothetical protein
LKSASRATKSDRRALTVGGTLDHDHAFRSDARCLLVGLRQARLTHQFGGCFEIAVRFDECLLALHHPRAGTLAELFNCFSRNCH